MPPRHPPQKQTRSRRPAGGRTARRRRAIAARGALATIALGSFAGGVLAARAVGATQRGLARRYVRYWERDDYRAMYSLLSPASRLALSEPTFAADYALAARTATLRSIALLGVGGSQAGLLRVRVLARTLLFGARRLTLLVGFDAAGQAIRFTGTLLFPGLLPGERLTRRTHLDARGTILAADGVALAEGPRRLSPIPLVARQIVGALGPIPASQRDAFAQLGYPPAAMVGQDGLEAIFQRQLAGRPGGVLLAGRRVLARARARPGETVRTTIVPALEQAALSALAGRYGGIVALDPRSGAVEAAVGLAFTDTQPPGSTMKIITASAALAAGLVSIDTVFPDATSVTIDGYTLHNAGDEDCGGTLLNAFAVSCNSVFAPLGARVGAVRLWEMARRFGFDEPPPFATALPSTIPPPDRIGDALAVGSSAIGQGRVLASPLEMADAAAAIADGGERPIPTLDATAPPRFVGVLSARVAGEVAQMMLAVVRYGTGTSAQIPGVAVAGKTGTAETRNTGGRNIAADTDSWFVAYAPAGQARVAVTALFPASGYGAATAAPAVREVLLAALGAS